MNKFASQPEFSYAIHCILFIEMPEVMNRCCGSFDDIAMHPVDYKGRWGKPLEGQWMNDIDVDENHGSCSVVTERRSITSCICLPVIGNQDLLGITTKKKTYSPDEDKYKNLLLRFRDLSE